MIPNQKEVNDMRIKKQVLLKHITNILLEESLISPEEHVHMLEEIRKEVLNDG